MQNRKHNKLMRIVERLSAETAVVTGVVSFAEINYSYTVYNDVLYRADPDRGVEYNDGSGWKKLDISRAPYGWKVAAWRDRLLYRTYLTDEEVFEYNIALDPTKWVRDGDPDVYYRAP